MNGRADEVVPGRWAALGRALAEWARRARDRHALAQLTARERRDMGLARWAIDDEIRKPFWRA